MATPPLPPGRALDLPGRGTTFIREIAGPPGAPVLFLLHGLSATADLNWWPAYGALGRHFRVIAIDHRGHGRGIRRRRRFRLADCADAAVAVADALGIERFTAVGYSMGGPIAQLARFRHPDRVEGLVLCATSRNFRGKPRERMMFATMPVMAAAARMAPLDALQRGMHGALAERLASSPLAAWGLSELRRHDMGKVAEAAAAIGSFSSHGWIGTLDVPAAVLVMTQDQLVPPHRQERLARSIPGATTHYVEGDHFVTALAPERFVPALVEASLSVTRRAARRGRHLRVVDEVAS